MSNCAFFTPTRVPLTPRRVALLETLPTYPIPMRTGDLTRGQAARPHSYFRYQLHLRYPSLPTHLEPFGEVNDRRLASVGHRNHRIRAADQPFRGHRSVGLPW